MQTEFALDLRLARRKAGFTQRDVALLLGISENTLSRFELGDKLPTLKLLIMLSFVYGRSFESLYSETMRQAREALKSRIGDLPSVAWRSVRTFNRESSLQKLERRLAADELDYGL